MSPVPARRADDAPVSASAFDLLCLTLTAVLAVHATHLPWWLSAALATLLAGRWWQRRQRPGCVPRWLKLPLLAVLTLMVVVTWGSIFGREPGSALAVGLLVLKLMETETTRDVRVGVSFACFALMAALLFGQGLVSTLVVALGLLPALATLRALEPGQLALDLPRQLAPGGALLLAALPLTLLAFVLVPRLNSPLWGAPGADQARTGLSDSMAPGDFTGLLTDDSPAMRVSFAGAPPARELRYFRAYVMWRYDGRRWQHLRSRSSAVPVAMEAGAQVDYRITLEPSQQRILPALDVPLAAPAQSRLTVDREILATRPVTHTLSYDLHSAVRYRLQPMLDEATRQRALRLPAHFNPRTLALGAQWRARYGADDAAIVRAGLGLLHDGDFRYTLTPAPLGRDAVDDFLFNTREGFCEHYASSFTVLMRAAGVPARVVTGYQGGYWNAQARYLLVRNSDAHAWTEVWLVGRGWVRTDPTAAARPERVTQGAAAAMGEERGWYRSDWLQGLRNHWDVVNRWWNQGVVGFDALRQRGLLTPFGVRDTDTRLLGMLIAISTLLFMGIGLGWALWRRRRRDPLREALRLLERKLARGGVVRRVGEGPQVYLSRAARALPARRDALTALTSAYLLLRYGQDVPAAEPLRAFVRAVRDFKVGRVVK
jgi:transglutaminase-like putative cysteine protease